MTNVVLRSSFAAMIVFFAAELPAEEPYKRLESKLDWSVFKAEDPTECWSASKPRDSMVTHDGQTASVDRGAIMFFVKFRPDSTRAEVSFSGGYSFAPGSIVRMDVEGKQFELIPLDDWAWPKSEKQDAEIIAAMKRATSFVLVSHSAKGIQVQDTFSLRGFSSSIDEAKRRCQ